MKKLYEKIWLGIDFAGLQGVSDTQMAGADFYNDFYKALFERYTGYDALDDKWRRPKEEVAKFIAECIPGDARVLPVGCGIGYIEQHIWHLHGQRIELHVQDFAPEALRWLRQVMPQSNIHTGSISQIPADCIFDFVFLSAVDYALPDDMLIELLIELRGRLKKHGCILLISASYLDHGFIKSSVRLTKEVVKSLLNRFGLYERGQFWGWMRSRSEYQAVMRQSGFDSVSDGFLVTRNQRTYWIKGSKA